MKFAEEKHVEEKCRENQRGDRFSHIFSVFFFLREKKSGREIALFALLFYFFSRAKSIFHARFFRIFPVFSRGKLLEKLQIRDFFRVLPVKTKKFCSGKSSHLRILRFFHGGENAFHAQKKHYVGRHGGGLFNMKQTLKDVLSP